MYQVIKLDGALRPVGTLGGVRSFSVARSIESDAPLVESASIEFDGPADWAGGWHRVERIGRNRTDLGVFFFEPSSVKVERGAATITADGYSVLRPASEESAPVGGYAAIGADGGSVVSSLLSCCPGRVVVDSTAIVPRNVVYKQGATRLEAAWSVLDACGLCLQINGRGDVHVLMMPTEAAKADAMGVLDGVSFGDRISYQRDADASEDLRPFDIVSFDVNGRAASGRIITQSFAAGASLVVSEEIGEANRDY